MHYNIGTHGWRARILGAPTRTLVRATMEKSIIFNSYANPAARSAHEDGGPELTGLSPLQLLSFAEGKLRKF